MRTPTPIQVPADVVYGPEANGWKIGLVVVPTVAQFGADLMVHVVVTNVSAREAAIVMYNSSCGYRLAVIDLQSQQTFENGCVSVSGASGGVAIGSTYVVTFNLRKISQRDDFTRRIIEHAGDYAVTVTGLYGKDHVGNERLIPVQSNTVTLRIGAAT